MQDWFDNIVKLTDLEAQLDMARWAWWMMVFTAISLALSFGALMGLFLSLRQTSTALKEARLGRQEANEANKVAHANAATANGLTERAYRNDIRPWLIVHGVEIEDFTISATKDGKRVLAMLTYEIKNIGKSPALNIRHECLFQAGLPNPNELLDDFQNIERLGNALPPGALMKRRFGVELVVRNGDPVQFFQMLIVLDYFNSDKSETHMAYWFCGITMGRTFMKTSHEVGNYKPHIYDPLYFRAT